MVPLCLMMLVSMCDNMGKAKLMFGCVDFVCHCERTELCDCHCSVWRFCLRSSVRRNQLWCRLWRMQLMLCFARFVPSLTLLPLCEILSGFSLGLLKSFFLENWLSFAQNQFFWLNCRLLWHHTDSLSSAIKLGLLGCLPAAYMEGDCWQTDGPVVAVHAMA